MESDVPPLDEDVRTHIYSFFSFKEIIRKVSALSIKERKSLYENSKKVMNNRKDNVFIKIQTETLHSDNNFKAAQYFLSVAGKGILTLKPSINTLKLKKQLNGLLE